MSNPTRLQIIGGEFRGRLLCTEGQMRPTTGRVRETAFNLCQYSVEGAHFLDLFAGSGAIGIEALSRGAAHVTFVEKDPQSLRALYKNIETFKLTGRVTIFSKDFLKAFPLLVRRGIAFNIIYADPPYGCGWSEKLLELIDSSHLLHPEGELFIEDSCAGSNFSPQNLFLKSERKMGMAYLSHFLPKAKEIA